MWHLYPSPLQSPAATQDCIQHKNNTRLLRLHAHAAYQASCLAIDPPWFVEPWWFDVLFSMELSRGQALSMMVAAVMSTNGVFDMIFYFC